MTLYSPVDDVTMANVEPLLYAVPSAQTPPTRRGMRENRCGG